MMKKLLRIVVLGLFWCSSSGAVEKYEKFLIKKKDGPEYFYYNLIIEDYNQYMIDTYTNNDCKNLPATLTYILDLTDCSYRSVKKNMRRNSINVNQDVIDAEHDFYTEVRSRAKTLVTKWNYNYPGDKKFEKELTEFMNFWKVQADNTNFYTRDIWTKYALRLNREYLTEKKNKKEELGPKINDDEILPASSGTGFFVSNNGEMITNNHVIEECTNIKAIYNGSELESKVLAVDKMNDLAIIKANVRPDEVFSVSSIDAELLEKVIVAGYPLGKKISTSIKATSGTITSLSGLGDNYAEFQTDAALNSGNSGGPIINEKGNVIGVAVSKWQEEGVESFNFGVKSSILRIFANANGLKFLSPNYKEMKKKDLGQLITGATVYLECWMTGKQIKQLIAQKNSRKAFYSKYK